MSRVVLHIDHLVLRGLRVDNLQAFTTGFEEGLARVVAVSAFCTGRFPISEQRRPRRGHAVIPRAASARRCGECVARGIAEALAP